MTLTKSLSLITLLALSAAPLAAQEETTTDTETVTEGTAEGTAPEVPAEIGTDLDMGTPVDEDGNPIAAAPQVGDQYVLNEEGDWTVRCIKIEEGDDPCQIYQLLQNEENYPVAEISMVSLDSGQAAAGATIVAPLGTLLTEQLTMRVDGGTARQFAFSMCNAGGCVSRVGFTAQDIALFKRGAAATLRLVPAGAPDQEVILDISLTGFTAAFDSLSN